MTFRRKQYQTLIGRLQERPRTLTFVTGPRQTGKTTLIQQVLADVRTPWRFVAVDEPDRRAKQRLPEVLLTSRTEVGPNKRDGVWLSRVWEEARDRATGSANGFILALDEVQKVPNWAETVKGLWDADRRAELPLHVVLAGSAPLLMQQGLTESLAGRFETIRLAHWAYSEMAQAFGFDLPRYVYFGGYPGGAEYDERRWRDYVLDALIAPNIERDILAMQRIEKPALLKQLFELGTEHSGQILAYSKMLGSLQDAGNTTTLARYVGLLRQAGLLVGLDQYRGTQLRRRASPPKWNTLNTALMTALSDYTFEEAQADRSYWGRLVESAVGAHLCNTAGRELEVCYWRDGPHEVDFVLRGRRRVWGIEVKSGQRRGQLTGLEAFAARFKGARRRLVGADGVPLEEFLSLPATHWLDEETRGVR